VEHKGMLIEDGIPAGNLYPKYSTQNPIARNMVNRFLNSVDGLVARVAPPDIHEVGCGEGHLISRYTSRNIKLTASDFSEQIITLAKSIADGQNLSVEFKVKSIYSLVAPEDMANLILCCEVFEHLEDPDLALNTIANVANPYLIASVPKEPIWRMLNMLRGKYLGDFGNTPGHLQHWSERKFVKFMESRFDILEVLTPFPWTLVLARVKQ
jgi:2-polyprenyl-3-methyl-5-hydroxy-6-metoxy-1,4-benzoquinol methylase